MGSDPEVRPAKQEPRAGIRERQIETVLRLILDSVDYTTGACRLNEMVGACLPSELLRMARAALELPPGG